MPRSKHQKHHHWDIDDPHDFLAEARKNALVYKAMTGTTLADAVARLIEAGYVHLMGGTVRNRGGAAAPRTAASRAGAAGLRLDATETDGSTQEPKYDEMSPEAA